MTGGSSSGGLNASIFPVFYASLEYSMILKDENMKNREVFFAIGILVISSGFYMLFAQTVGVKLGDNLNQVPVINDGIMLIIMGIAMVIVSSREWDSGKRIK